MNFINFEKMACERAQMLQAFLSQGSMFPNDLKITNSIRFNPLTLLPDIVHACNMYDFTRAHITHAVQYRGTDYKEGQFLPLNLNNETFQVTFGQVILIVISRESPYFVCILRNSIYNEETALYSLEMGESPIYNCVHYSQLLDYYPLNGYTLHNETLITLKHQYGYCY